MTSPDETTERPDAELPSLTALTAFEAALRQGSFTAAARELGRTQGAVSRQVALLESQIGAELFHREQGGLRATRAAEVFGRRIRGAIGRIRSAVADLREPVGPEGVLRLALLPTFGTTWLIPRLPRFLAAHPEISVELTTSLARFDFDDGEIDAAIHYGKGEWGGARPERLMAEEVVVVCAPRLAREAASPRELSGRTLLQLVSRPRAWSLWLGAQGAAHVVGDRGPRFEHHMMVVEAARAGLGYALLPDFVAEGPLADGTLTEPFPGTRFRTKASYWLVYPDRSLELSSLDLFRRWLKDEIKGEGR